MRSFAIRFYIMLAGLLVGLLLTPELLVAQQSTSGQPSAAAPQPLPSPTTNSVLADQPKTEGALKLAPVAPPPIAAAADKIPVDQLRVPPGFKLELYASGMTNARSLARGDKGTIFVSTRLLDHIYAITEKDGKREVKPLFSGTLFRPNGLAFKDGTLYIAELNKISKVEHIEDNLDNPPKPVVIYSDLPSDEPHGWKYLTIGPDNKLYFQVGAPCNICMPPPTHAQIRRIQPPRCSSSPRINEIGFPKRPRKTSSIGYCIRERISLASPTVTRAICQISSSDGVTTA